MDKRASDKEILRELKELREEALFIYAAKNLYNIWDFIPKNVGQDDSDKIPGEFIKQGYEPRVYTKWSEAVEELFFKNLLNVPRFKQVTESVDPTKFSVYPASIFVRKYKEVDNLVTGKVSLEDYKVELNRPTKWPVVTLEGGTIWQGRANHPFKDERYIRMLELLWDRRQIVNPFGKVVVRYSPTTRDEIFKLKIKQIVDNGSIGVVRNGIKKAMISKKINLKLINLNSKNVYLEVIQE